MPHVKTTAVAGTALDGEDDIKVVHVLERVDESAAALKVRELLWVRRVVRALPRGGSAIGGIVEIRDVGWEGSIGREKVRARDRHESGRCSNDSLRCSVHSNAFGNGAG
jgi:hypothetical protein